MNQLHIDVLRENIETLNLSLKRLMYSYTICGKISLKEAYSEEEFMSFEAMASRYARTTDMLVNKALRSVDTVESEDIGTIIDIMNRAEKRGIASAELLHRIKDLRNSIAHEYVTENLTGFFGNVLEYTPLLKSVIEKLNEYCSRYGA
jgi:uncharacterized protein YutE (UPF0331/DUF86 family)